jgi:hypothetical protein
VGFEIVVAVVAAVRRGGFVIGEVGADPDGWLAEEASEESELRNY